MPSELKCSLLTFRLDDGVCLARELRKKKVLCFAIRATFKNCLL